MSATSAMVDSCEELLGKTAIFILDETSGTTMPRMGLSISSCL